MNVTVSKKRGSDPPWASFSDALSGVLFVFILTTCWFALRLAEATAKQDAELKRLEGYRETARALVGSESEPGALTKCLQEKGTMDVVPQKSDARILLYLPRVNWFVEGTADLSEDQKPAVTSIRVCLEALYGQPAPGFQIDAYNVTVFFEGHTDALTVKKDENGAGFSSNWELSAARGAAVLREVIEPKKGTAAPGVLSEKVGQGRLRLLPVGLGDTEPAWARLCEKDRRASRDDIDQAVCDDLPWEEVRDGNAPVARQRVVTALGKHQLVPRLRDHDWLICG